MMVTAACEPTDPPPPPPVQLGPRDVPGNFQDAGFPFGSPPVTLVGPARASRVANGLEVHCGLRQGGTLTGTGTTGYGYGTATNLLYDSHGAFQAQGECPNHVTVNVGLPVFNSPLVRDALNAHAGETRVRKILHFTDAPAKDVLYAQYYGSWGSGFAAPNGEFIAVYGWPNITPPSCIVRSDEVLVSAGAYGPSLMMFTVAPRGGVTVGKECPNNSLLFTSTTTWNSFQLAPAA